MAQNQENYENDDSRYRVVTSITMDERAKLEVLAKDDGRSMSSYLRQLLRQEIDAHWD